MRYAFEDCVLDAARRELRRAGGGARFKPKVYLVLVLVYLAQHDERMVTHRELLDHSWPKIAIEAISIAHNISDIRRAVGESAQGPARDPDIPTPPTPHVDAHTPTQHCRSLGAPP
jgi:DNA-binding winged helix-turn-helix (wHTH) protein